MQNTAFAATSPVGDEPRQFNGESMSRSCFAVRLSHFLALTEAEEEALLRLEENEHTPEDKFPLRLAPSFSIAGEKQIAVKHMPFIVKDISGQVLKNESKPELVFDFQRGDQIELLIELSNPGQHNFVVQCKCTAEIEEADQ